MVVKPLRARAIALFHEAFAATPRAAASAPGRVHLLGEHTHYNGGPVLLIATRERTAVAVGPGEAGVLEVVAGADGQRERVRFGGGLLLVDAGARPDEAARVLEQRQAECEAAVARLKLELPELYWLASWPAGWLARLKKALREPLRSRAVHIVGETARARFGAELLARRRLE